MSEPYWETGEVPEVVEEGKQRFKHYKQAGVIEITTLLQEDSVVKEIRRETISAYKLQCNAALRGMLLDFLEGAGIIVNADKVEAEE